MRTDLTAGRAGAAVVVATLLAACGGGSPAQPAYDPAGTPVTFVQADVDFAVALSQHHGQALRMTDLASTRARAADVQDLSTQIASIYAPQVDEAAAWITAWASAGAELPAHDIGHGEPGPGMLDDSAVDRLEKLKGSAFDRQFRRLMTRHHRGGLDLVQQHLAAGVNPEARALAEQLRTSQTRQLEELAARS